MRFLSHPERDEIDITAVMGALSDPTRLAIVQSLFKRAPERGDLDTDCGSFGGLSSKSNLSYHFAKLREAGVTRTRVEGTRRLIALRRDDLDARFPGLLDAIVAAAEKRNDLAGLLPEH